MADWAAMVEARDKRIAELEERDRTLTALEAFGVDNWDGYDEAIQSLEDED